MFGGLLLLGLSVSGVSDPSLRGSVVSGFAPKT